MARNPNAHSSSVVTRHTIHICLMVVVIVTIDAPAHLQLVGRDAVLPLRLWNEVQLVHLLNLSMTSLTRNVGRNMPVMSKLNMLRQSMNLNPLNGLFVFPMLFEDSNPLNFVILSRKYQEPVL